MKYILTLLLCLVAGCGTTPPQDASVMDSPMADAVEAATPDVTPDVAMDAMMDVAMPPLEASVMDVTDASSPDGRD